MLTNQTELKMLIKALKELAKDQNATPEIIRFAKGLLGYLNTYYFTHF